MASLYTGRRLSFSEVAEEVGCAKSTVQHALELTGTTVRTRRKHAREDIPGTYHGGQTPYGAKVVKSTIVDHIREQRVVRTMKKLHAEGASFSAIAEYLNSKGVKTKRGGRWHHMTVGRILRGGPSQ